MMAGGRKCMALSIKYNEVDSVVVHVEVRSRDESLNGIIIPLFFWLNSQDLMEHLRIFSGTLVPIITSKTRMALLKHSWNAVE
jgi:hypothetical protein